MIEEIIGKLKEKGYRITESRKKIIEIFVSNPERHYTIEQLITEINEKTNVATMYNNVSFLIEEKVINEFHIGDKRYFELNDVIHAHFVCRKCLRFENIEIPGLDCLDVLISKRYNYTVDSSKIEFYGCCDLCKNLICASCAETECTHQKVNLVTIINEEEFEIDEQLIEKYVKFLGEKIENIKPFSLVFINDETMQQMNNEYRGLDYVTDVLSFEEDEEQYMGDIIICYSKIIDQAQAYEHSFQRELLFLITHGVLHLLGYDHQTESESKTMFGLQEQLLTEYGVMRNEKL